LREVLAMNFVENFMRTQMIIFSCIFSPRAMKLIAYISALIAGLVILFLLLIATTNDAHAKSRIKDIVTVEGIRDNLLVGYGLVVGLNGTGDKLNNTTFTEKSLQAFLERLGVNASDSQLKAKNVAAVTVTASFPTFARSGSRIDVTISALGDAKSLQGGVLIATPLIGADGEVYAVAQGAVAIGGFEASGESGSSISKGVPTSGYISNGGIVEREVDFELNSLKKLDLALRNPDTTTATKIAEAINTKISGNEDAAVVLDPGTISLKVPNEYSNAVASLLMEIEQLEVETDQQARVIIDEASGTIVMNENVRVDTVAIAQGNLVISVSEQTGVSQPTAFTSEGSETVVVPISKVSVEEVSGKMAVMNSGASLGELVGGLNALGIGPRDLINILQTIKAAGALQAKIEAR